MSKLAFIVCTPSQWPKGEKRYGHPVIYTLRFSLETEHDLKEKLDEFLESLSFPTRYLRVTFTLRNIPNESFSLVENLQISEEVDLICRPGKK